MAGTFACPECGSDVSPGGLSPGRQVRCAECQTLIEVPFLPRAAAGRGVRRTRTSFSARAWAWRAGAAVAVLIAVAVVGRLARSQRRATHAEDIEALVASSQEAERSGRPDRALADIEAALKLARDGDLAGEDRLEELGRRRDELSRREAEARLDALPGLECAEAIGEGLTLWKRAEADPALGPLKDRLRSELARLASAQLEEARRRRDAGQPGAALAACERTVAATASLPLDVGGQARDDAWALAGELVAAHGVAIDPIRGQFLRGSPRSYAAELDPLLADALRRKGYLVRPDASPFRALWDDRAPYHLSVEVVESQNLPYYDTPQRAGRVEAHLRLMQKDWPTWEVRVAGRSRPSLAGMNTAGMGRRVMSSPHDPQIERRLLDDAHAALLEQLPLKIVDLPAPAVATTTGTP
jgi:hypothetical protein